MILSFFSSQGWESWDVGHRPLIPERMPVLVDDDLVFEDGPGAPRPSVAVNQWLRELPASGAPAPATWDAYARTVRDWIEFLGLHGVGVFDSRERLKLALSGYAEHRAAGPARQRFSATTWGRHMSILSLFYRWAMEEGHAQAEPFSYRTARALFAGTGREVRVNLAVRRTPKPHVTIRYLEPGHYRQAARLVRDADADAALVFYLSKADPLLVLRDLLGHSSVLTTEKYIKRLDTTRIYRDACEHAGLADGLISEATAGREAAAEFGPDAEGGTG